MTNKPLMYGMIFLVVSVLLMGGIYFYRFQQYKKIVANIAIETPDLISKNGLYNGSFDAYLVAANVEVMVADGKITQITLIKHKNERGAAAEEITDKVIAAQSLQVDTISGATNSSKVILKAIENALNSQAKA